MNPQLFTPQGSMALAQAMGPGVRWTGRPGRYHIEGVGEREFVDVRYDHIYDRVQIPAANAKGDELVWFRDVQGKSPLETSMRQMAKLPEGQEAVVLDICFMIRDDCPPKDKAEIYSTGFGKLVFDDDNTRIKGPITLFPQRYGMYGNIMTTKTDSDEGVVTNGIPSPGANPWIPAQLRPYISVNRTFMFHLHFYEACDLPSEAATYAWVIMPAIMARPVVGG